MERIQTWSLGSAEHLLAEKVHRIRVGSACTWVYVCMYTIYAWTCIDIHETCFSTSFLPVALKESPTAITGNMHVGWGRICIRSSAVIKQLFLASRTATAGPLTRTLPRKAALCQADSLAPFLAMSAPSPWSVLLWHCSWHASEIRTMVDFETGCSLVRTHIHYVWTALTLRPQRTSPVLSLSNYTAWGVPPGSAKATDANWAARRCFPEL